PTAPATHSAGACASEPSTALQRATHRHFVGPLQVAPHGEAASKPGHAHAISRCELRDVHRRRVAFEIRVRGEDHLLDPALLQALRELRDLEVVGTYAVHRRDRAM